jgi:hypothetical protein
MSYDRKHLKELTKPLYGFGGKIIKPVRVITLHILFGSPQNPCTECIIFDVVDMMYPYNAIFRRGLLNTFEAALHSGYLCLKILATFDVISVCGSQKEARNIEQGFTPGHKNVHFLRDEIEQYRQIEWPSKQEASTKFKKGIEAEGDLKKVVLDPRVPDIAVCFSTEARPEEQVELLAFLDKNNDVFAWSTSDLIGVSRDVIEHKLQVNLDMKPKK